MHVDNKIQLIIGILITYIFKITLAICGTVNELPNVYSIYAYIDNAPEDELNDLQRFINNLPQHPNNVQNTLTDQSQQRFGWESLGIFLAATVIGYILIRHGSEIFNWIQSTLGDMVNSSLDTVTNVTRESVRQSVTNAIRNPDNARLILVYVSSRGQSSTAIGN